jgi:hypothetical protein
MIEDFCFAPVALTSAFPKVKGKKISKNPGIKQCIFSYFLAATVGLGMGEALRAFVRQDYETRGEQLRWKPEDAGAKPRPWELGYVALLHKALPT